MTTGEVSFMFVGFLIGVLAGATIFFCTRKRFPQMPAQLIINAGSGKGCDFCVAKNRLAVEAGAIPRTRYMVLQEGSMSKYEVTAAPPLTDEDTL